MENQDPKSRQLYVIRHAERIDFTFGAWIPACFDSTGTYTRRDLNMPASVPKRKGGPYDFFKDCPLTKIGQYQATLHGEAIKDAGVTFSHVFSSPSLRCVETCTNILKASGQSDIQINIEPGLFEWLAWYHEGMPVWMTVQELQNIGFNLNLNYKPVLSLHEMQNTKESSEEYYMRSYLVVQTVLQNTSEKGGNILMVGHAATLDTCTRQLTGNRPRNSHDLQNLVYKIPYCSVAVAEEGPEGKWFLKNPPFPPLMHSNNMKFDWSILQT